MRLQAFLARAGAAPSRRKAEALISAGRVSVNGETALLLTDRSQSLWLAAISRANSSSSCG